MTAHEAVTACTHATYIYTRRHACIYTRVVTGARNAYTRVVYAEACTTPVYHRLRITGSWRIASSSHRQHAKRSARRADGFAAGSRAGGGPAPRTSALCEDCADCAVRLCGVMVWCDGVVRLCGVIVWRDCVASLCSMIMHRYDVAVLTYIHWHNGGVMQKHKIAGGSGPQNPHGRMRT